MNMRFATILIVLLSFTNAKPQSYKKCFDNFFYDDELIIPRVYKTANEAFEKVENNVDEKDDVEVTFNRAKEAIKNNEEVTEYLSQYRTSILRLKKEITDRSEDPNDEINDRANQITYSDATNISEKIFFQNGSVYLAENYILPNPNNEEEFTYENIKNLIEIFEEEKKKYNDDKYLQTALEVDTGRDEKENCRDDSLLKKILELNKIESESESERESERERQCLLFIYRLYVKCAEQDELETIDDFLPLFGANKNTREQHYKPEEIINKINAYFKTERLLI